MGFVNLYKQDVLFRLDIFGKYTDILFINASWAASGSNHKQK